VISEASIETPIGRHYLPCGKCGGTEFACPQRFAWGKCEWEPKKEEKDMTNPFKVGDTVKCIDGTVTSPLSFGRLATGSIGTITKVKGVFVGFSGDPRSGQGDGGWHHTRFIHVTNVDRPVDQQDTYQPTPGENPKARHGAAKSPLGLIPAPAEVAISEVFGLGAAKYGAYNWRETKVEAMTYAHAMRRHLAAWLDGENQDPESGQSHLAHVAACAAILLDAYAIGKIDDNRPPAGVAGDLIRSLTKKVA
jgi:hypothetical protein